MGLIFWLWQRQPQFTSPNQSQSEEQNKKTKEKQPDVKTTPQDGFVTDQPKITLKGISKTDTYVAIITTSFDYLAKTKSYGLFEKEIELSEGLNLVKIVSLDDNLNLEKEENLTYFRSKIKKFDAVFAGNVKSIFANLITISTLDGEKKITYKSSTEIILPSPIPQLGVGDDNTNIRVGDYIIATGKINTNGELDALQIDVRRDNKPQITKKIVAAQLLSNIRQNIFSVKNLKDSKIIEFSLNKDTQVFQDLELKDTKIIEKDKKAIIIFTLEDDISSPSKIFILP